MSFNIILMLNKKSETALKGKYYIEAMSRELNEYEKSGLDEELEKLHALIHFKITE